MACQLVNLVAKADVFLSPLPLRHAPYKATLATIYYVGQPDRFFALTQSYKRIFLLEHLGVL